MKNEKKKAELKEKENGNWDCPDVSCDECDHHRSVEWCSLAIPNHEEIDETYKMVNEAFFEGFSAAEKQYRLLVETVEELDKELAEAEAVQGEWIEVEVLPEVYDIEGVKTWGSKMQCDQCGFRHTAIEGRMAQYNFCPNCGARMETR